MRVSNLQAMAYKNSQCRAAWSGHCLSTGKEGAVAYLYDSTLNCTSSEHAQHSCSKGVNCVRAFVFSFLRLSALSHLHANCKIRWYLIYLS